jgi:multidrug efflux pump subunit AcrA (membrane-fusion protein)
MRRMLTVWMTVAGALAGPGQAQQPPASAIVHEVGEQAVRASLTLVGTVEPKRRSVLSSEVDGLVRMTDKPLEVGDYVEAGQIICRLKDDTLKLDLAEAKSALSRFEAQLAELEAGTRTEEIQLAEASVDEAQAIFDRWQNEKDRIDRLRADGSASNKEFRDITSEYLAASKRLTQAKLRHLLAVEGPRKEIITQARHAAAAQKAVADRIADQLDKTKIRAPFGAYVIEKRTEVGQWIDAGGPVCEVVDLDEARVRILVPETAIPFVRLGENVPVRIDALDRNFTATVRFIVPQADPTARTFPVEVVIPNPRKPHHAIMSGMFARVTVPAGTRVTRMVVPVDAVVYEGRAERVFVVREDAGQTLAVPIAVKTGLPVADPPGWIALESSTLKVGDHVVTRGNERLTGASPIIIMQEKTASPPPSSPPTTQAAGTPTGRSPV